MISWTDSARRCFAEYADRARKSLGTAGVDVNEVLDDLKRHVEEELRASGLTVLTEDNLRHLLARFGDAALLQDSTVQSAWCPNHPSPAPPDTRKKPGYVLLFFGVLLPLITILFELFTGVSAGVLFDPLPSWLHVIIVTLVPAINIWMWIKGRRRVTAHASWFGWLNGAAFGTSLLYAAMYLPFTPFACLGIIYVGLGLIPLTPLLAAIATPLLRKAYCRSVGLERLPGLWRGGGLAVAVLLALQLPALLTYRGMAKAVSEDPDTQRRGIQLLRTFGDEEMLLRACYGQLTRPAQMDVIQNLAGGNTRINADQARGIYYRVTGRAFNSVPPPSLYTRTGRWNVLENEFTWDDGLGGDAVAGRVKGLSLGSSRLDAQAETDTALVYCEWTMEFRNDSTQAREARAQIALPPGGIVSRLTLWVDGEEREAAFAGRAAVKEAYREVAIVRRRDPVLVTTCGPDRVLMQCFPIPANGGLMKIRLGITAPMLLDSLERGRFVWPRILERNFTVPARLRHSLWLASPDAIESGSGVTSSEGGKFNWKTSVADRELDEAACSTVLHRAADPRESWFPALAAGEFIRQRILSSNHQPFRRAVFVVDGSAGMQRHLSDIAEALRTSNKVEEITAILAGDETHLLFDKPRKAVAETLVALSNRLNQVRCAGGQDNLPALEMAWDIAADSDRGVIIWIHGPQPALLGSAEQLRQRLDRSAKGVQLHELQVRAGPNRLLEKLDGLASVHQVPRERTVKEDLVSLLAQLLDYDEELTFVRDVVRAEPMSGRKAGSRHIERLWAREEVDRHMLARQYAAATTLAGRQQIVTSCSGAVVLETKQQFERHNLTPADPSTVPAIPEPETWALAFCGAILLACARRFRRRQKN